MIQFSIQPLPGIFTGARAAGSPLETVSDFALALADLAAPPGGPLAPAAPPSGAVATTHPEAIARQMLAADGKNLPAVDVPASEIVVEAIVPDSAEPVAGLVQTNLLVAPSPPTSDPVVSPSDPELNDTAPSPRPFGSRKVRAPLAAARLAPEVPVVPMAVAMPAIVQMPAADLAVHGEKMPARSHKAAGAAGLSDVPAAPGVMLQVATVDEPATDPAGEAPRRDAAAALPAPPQPPAAVVQPPADPVPPRLDSGDETPSAARIPTTSRTTATVPPVRASIESIPAVSPEPATPTAAVPNAARTATRPTETTRRAAAPAATPPPGRVGALPTGRIGDATMQTAAKPAHDIAPTAPSARGAVAPVFRTAADDAIIAEIPAMRVLSPAQETVVPVADLSPRVAERIAQALSPVTPAAGRLDARPSVAAEPFFADTTSRTAATPAADTPRATAIAPAAAGVASAPAPSRNAEGAAPTPVVVIVAALPTSVPPAPLLQPAAQAFAAAMFAASGPAEPRCDDVADDAPLAVVTGNASAVPHIQMTPTPATVGGQQPALDLAKGDWMASMIDRIETLRDESGAVRETRMKLAPDALGNVEVSVRRDENGALQVRIAADTAQARAILTDAAPKLAEMAEARGVKLGGSSVDAGVGSGAGSAHQDRRDTPPAPAPAVRRPVAANDITDTDSDSRIA